MKGQVIAIGGGGFTEGRDPGLDAYVLQQAGVKHPRIGFIGTASGDSDRNIANFYSRHVQLDCRPSHLALFRRTPDIAEWIASQDILFVGGGNTKSMLAAWAGWGLADLLRDAAARGTVLAGISAGAICWFESGVTDSNAGVLGPLPCLGFLAGSCCPHYSLELERKPTYQRLLLTEAIQPGVAIDDGAAVHYVDGRPVRVISGSKGMSAYAVAPVDGALQTNRIPETELVEVY
ncbi:MAG: Type 1 glutamine amidotransferase-like domain-containing protein [Opitutales bacterium]|nr:Type 1 glutamine amidotransferase-like domain-containing protein [Opitutales bacterium]